MWHLLTIGAVITCGLLAAWQWGKAGSAMGSALNIGYGLQWPLFAVFFAVMWFRMLRLEIRSRNGEQPEVAEPRAMPVSRSAVEPEAEPEDTGPSPFTPRPATVPPITDETDPSSPPTTACSRHWPSGTTPTRPARRRTGPAE